MFKNIEPSNDQIIAVLQEVDPQFESSLKLLKVYGNTSVNIKHFDMWVNTCHDVLYNVGFVKTSEECVERLRSLVSKRVGFHVYFRKAESKQLQCSHFWRRNEFSSSIIFEKKAN